jgi:hypothetical protein
MASSGQFEPVHGWEAQFAVADGSSPHLASATLVQPGHRNSNEVVKVEKLNQLVCYSFIRSLRWDLFILCFSRE